MWLRLCANLLLLFCCAAVSNENVKMSAFGTLGLTFSDSEQYGYRKDISYDKGVYAGDVNLLNNSLLGLQFDVSLNQELDFVGQAVLRDMPISSFDRYVTLAFLRYSPTVDWTFRIGRMAPDIFLISEYRDIDIAYTWATPPSEIYGIVPYRHIDGADASYLLRMGPGMLTSTLFFGTSEGEVTSGHSGASDSAIGHIDTVELDRVFGFSFTYDLIDWSIRAKYTRSTIGTESAGNQLLASYITAVPAEIWPDASTYANSLLLEGERVAYASLSTQGYINNWILSAELAHIRSTSIQIPRIYSGYISAAYQMDEYRIFGVYSTTTSDLYQFDEPGVAVEHIPELISVIEQSVNFYTPNQDTFSLGLRWDIDTNIAATVQWNHTQIGYGGSALWISENNLGEAQTVNMVFASVSFSL